jgi:hypothetical protein
MRLHLVVIRQAHLRDSPHTKEGFIEVERRYKDRAEKDTRRAHMMRRTLLISSSTSSLPFGSDWNFCG